MFDDVLHTMFLKKNQSTPRPSEHPPVMGGKMSKRLGGIKGCKLFSLFFWCPCMAFNVSVQYNGGLLPDIILLTQCYYHRGTRLKFKCHEEVLYLQPMIPIKRFDIFSPSLGDAQKV